MFPWWPATVYLCEITGLDLPNASLSMIETVCSHPPLATRVRPSLPLLVCITPCLIIRVCRAALMQALRHMGHDSAIREHGIATLDNLASHSGAAVQRRA